MGWLRGVYLIVRQEWPILVKEIKARPMMPGFLYSPKGLTVSEFAMTFLLLFCLFFLRLFSSGVRFVLKLRSFSAQPFCV